MPEWIRTSKAWLVFRYEISDLFLSINVYTSIIGYTSSNADSGVAKLPKVTKKCREYILYILRTIRQTSSYIRFTT